MRHVRWPFSTEQLDTPSGVAKGLTRLTDGVLIFSEEADKQNEQLDAINRARDDLRMIKLRDSVLNLCCPAGVVDL